MAVIDTCSWGGCGRKAKWQVVIKLWALVQPKAERDDSNCIPMLWNVTACDECRPKMKAQDFLMPAGKERIATALDRAGKMPPDFDNAVLDFEPIIDKPIDPAEVVRQNRHTGKIIEG